MAPLRLLIVDDQADDAALVVDALERAGLEPAGRRVETLEEFEQALTGEEWDAVVCDHVLPECDAVDVLEVARKHRPDIPFIVVSGLVDEDATVAAMRAGAHDYVKKTNLRRLAPALERELAEAEGRRQSRLAQQQLRSFEQLLAESFQQFPALAWVTDPELQVTWAVGDPGQVERVLGQCLAEVAGRTSEVVKKHELALRGAASTFELTVRDRTYLAHVQPLRSSEGGIDGVVGAALDVTERKAAQEALRATEARFRAVIEHFPDLIAIVAPDTTLSYVSPAVEAALGYSSEEVLGTSLAAYVHPDEQSGAVAVFELAQTVAGSTRLGEFRMRHKDGSWRLIEGSALNLIDDPAVRGVLLTGRDITARRAMEDRLQQAERLEAVGQLAGGIAHDFNNVLTAIRGFGALAARRARQAELPDIEADVQEIDAAAERAAKLIRQLLAFGRREVSRPVSLDPTDVLLESEGLLRRLIREDIDLRITAESDCGRVRADPSELEQVLVNLIVNARDAMPAGGTVTVAVENVELGGDEAAVTPPLPGGRYVSLTVADRGSGIDASTLPHIFEPFYTTKAPGEGTGLGLSTVWGIVTQCGGGIRVDTEVGHGTAFTVYLPQEPSRVEDGRVAEPGALPAAGSEMVLLLEDEQPVRRLLARVLREQGYRVLVADRPSDALQQAREEPIDLLITDVVMPEMNGRELWKRLAERRPGLPVLFISGYARGLADVHGELEPGMSLLEKPFDMDRLCREVRRVLDAGPVAVAVR